MRNATRGSRGKDPVPSRYRAHLLFAAEPTERGMVYRRGDERFLLVWGRVKRGFAAEVGEPEGVCTIVFDLVVEVAAGGCVACRFDAEPGDAAQTFGRAVELGIGGERCDFSLRAVAADGYAARSFSDLELYEEACLEAVRFKHLE